MKVVMKAITHTPAEIVQTLGHVDLDVDGGK